MEPYPQPVKGLSWVKSRVLFPGELRGGLSLDTFCVGRSELSDLFSLIRTQLFFNLLCLRASCSPVLHLMMEPVSTLYFVSERESG